MSVRASFYALTAAVVLSCAVAGPSFAAPVINGFTGTLAHGSVITINGSNFGSKNPAPPVVWADGETGVAQDFFDQVLPNQSGQSYDTAFRATIRGEAQAHALSTRYLVGAHYNPNGAPDYQRGYNVGAYKRLSTTPLSKTFISYYYKVDSRFADPIATRTGNENYKLMLYQDNQLEMYVGSTGANYWYNNVFLETWFPPEWRSLGNATGSGAPYPQYYGRDADGTRETPWPHQPGTWRQLEFVSSHAGTGNGATHAAFADGVRFLNMYGYNEPFSVYGVGIGGFFRPYGAVDSTGTPVNWRYFDDVYVDTTWARVVVANAATWTASTVRAMQVPSTWSSTVITVTVNFGGIPDPNGAYLYVFDDAGTVNAQGYPICQNSCPSPPTNLRVR